MERNVRSKKWLLGCSYNHHKENIAFHLSNISAALGKLSTDFENIIQLGDLHFEVKEKTFSDFLSTYSLKNLVEQITCFNNPDNSSCIDLTLINLREGSKITVYLKWDSLAFTSLQTVSW